MASDRFRVVRVRRREISVYKLFVGAGIYFGIAICSIVGGTSGISVMRLALAAAGCAAAGLVGARLYHLILFRASYRSQIRPNELWNTSSGGGGLFGGLLAVVIVSPAMASVAGTSFGIFWDHLSIALLVGAIFTRFGCFLNGCCGGRETAAPFFGLRWHNYHGENKRRIPVQLLEIGWLGIAAGGLIYCFSRPHLAGSLALGVLAWYGLGRFILEPLREEPDTVSRFRINQVIAAVLIMSAAFLFLLLK